MIEILTLATLPENFTPEHFMQLDRESLDKVPFEIAKWQCKIKLCQHYTRVRDYGIHPFYYSPRGVKGPNGLYHWINVRDEFLICYAHRKYFNKPHNDIPLKRSEHGGVIWGIDDTKKPIILR